MTHLIERKYHAHFLTPKRMTVSLAKASLCRREAREMEKRECAEDDGKGKEIREAPTFPSSHRPPRALHFLITVFIRLTARLHLHHFQRE